MTQTQDFAPATSGPLPDVFSSALSGLFERVRPAIVQVHNERRGGGTGVVWQEDGRILTNNHVVPDDQGKIQVHFTDGRTLEAKVLHRNPQLDLAVLKTTGEGFTALPLGDSATLRVGEWVFAIGHPWGQRWTVTAGIVSTFSTIKIAENATTQYIRSDARLAPGNSGGPLLNADGEIVGINAMIFGGDQSISIPSNAVSNWLNNLPRRRNTLGIELQIVALPAHMRQQVAGQGENGLLVVGTSSRPEAYEDLLIGDIILQAEGTAINDVAALRQVLTQRPEGGTVSLTLVRGGVVITVDAALLAVDNV